MKINYKTFVSLLILAFVLFQSLQNPNVQTPQIVQKSPTPTATAVQNQTYLVTKVIDGDTIEIEGGKRVRYIGVDAPELYDPRLALYCYGKEAAEKNIMLVLGKKVLLEKDVSETDKFGRLLRYVFVDNIFINEQLVKEGFAQISTYPPDIKYQNLFGEAQKEARKEKKGLWGLC